MDGKTIIMSQKLKTNRSDNRGGSRKNSGRKTAGDIKYQRVVTLEQKIALDNLLEEMRKQLNQQ